MKAQLFSVDGEKKGTTDLPKIFSSKIREDIVQKVYESEKITQPYAAKKEAGMRHSAIGTISHTRHDWKAAYGKGISRIPRKTMSRRGTQFFWVGASIPGTRGGRKAHPPVGIGRERKINKKELQLALNSAYAATANSKFIENRYATIKNFGAAPIIIESLPQKSKSLFSLLQKIFADNFSLVVKNKSVRPGRGKLRGRKYKSNAGALIVVASDEKAKFSGVDVVQVKQVRIADLYPLGRITLYTQKAIHELSTGEKVK